MTIAQMREVSNRAVSGIPKDVLVLGLVLASSSLAFGLGMLAEKQLLADNQDKGFKIEQMASTTAEVLPETAAAVGAVAGAAIIAPEAPVGKYVASKNGTKYYLPGCKSADRIKTENRVWFATEADAKSSGRTPASNCPGL